MVMAVRMRMVLKLVLAMGVRKNDDGVGAGDGGGTDDGRTSTAGLPAHTIRWRCGLNKRPPRPVAGGMKRTCRRIWPKGWREPKDERRDGGHVRHP